MLGGSRELYAPSGKVVAGSGVRLKYIGSNLLDATSRCQGHAAVAFFVYFRIVVGKYMRML